MTAPGILAIWHDASSGREASVRDWYAREHHFERLAIPGFVEMHRFDRVQGEGGKMLCLYRTTGVNVFTSQAYLARLANPTPETRANMPNFRHMSRTICTLRAQVGRAEGGYLGVVSVAGGLSAGWVEQLSPRLHSALESMPLLRLRCIAAAPQPSRTPDTAEILLRGSPDSSIAGAVLVDAETIEAAQQAIAEFSANLAASLAAGSHLQHAVYRLAFASRT